MSAIKSGYTKIIIDEEGFLEQNSIWNGEIAKIIAEHEEIRYLKRISESSS